ncbi:hypothetical protein K438DRAFT_1774296 [Mycena galopus ATCC 62051]|nr:hypothetical protein K438DRAFT_1774296 [Mycena galopus ATCC 62051]
MRPSTCVLVPDPRLPKHSFECLPAGVGDVRKETVRKRKTRRDSPSASATVKLGTKMAISVSGQDALRGLAVDDACVGAGVSSYSISTSVCTHGAASPSPPMRYAVLNTHPARSRHPSHSRRCSIVGRLSELLAVGARNSGKARTDVRCRTDGKDAVLSIQMRDHLRGVVKSFKFLARFRKPVFGILSANIQREVLSRLSKARKPFFLVVTGTQWQKLKRVRHTSGWPHNLDQGYL